MADELKAQGNSAFTAKDFPKAIEIFTKAIELDPSNHVLYSNRSASHASLRNFDDALKDAIKTTELKPGWGKGFSRKGAALHGLKRYQDALDAYDEALRLEPTNAQAKAGVGSVREAIRKESAPEPGAPDIGIGNIFSDPGLLPKLASNPKTSQLLQDPAFVAKLGELQRNPASGLQDALKDPRMMQVVAVALGLDMQMPTNPSPSHPSTSDTPMPDVPLRSENNHPEMEQRTQPDDPEEVAAVERRASAEEEKKLGTEQYKKRQFDDAIEHYQKAWELFKDITYLNNLAAAKFEKGDYHGCIEDCERAVSEGREIFADYKTIAKSFARMGTTYQKMGNLESAIEYYQRSLTEHRTPEVLAKLRAAEKTKIEGERTAYIDPEKAEEAREEGNKLFKEADWPGAIKSYSEMVKRAPDDPRGYTNRAAALTKLMSFPEAVKDCDVAIMHDPTFMRAYIRKAQAYLAMREFSKCLDTCTEASARDSDGKHTNEIQQIEQKAMMAMYAAREDETEEETMARIQRDPEIASIISDPVMQSILQQAKGNPQALNEHMKNPAVRAKIQKLMASGVIRIGR